MRTSSMVLINRLAAAYVMLFCFVPPIQVGTIYRLIAIGSAGVWLLTALFIDPYFINGRVKNLLLLSLLCLGFMFLSRLNIESIGSAFTNLIQTIIIIIVAFISFFMFKNDRKFLSVILTIVLILICYYCITTIQATIENPYASRIANSEWLEERWEGNENVGLYGYVYMCVFVLPTLLYKVLNHIKINKLFDFLSYVAIFLIYIMVMLAGYMIAMLCTVVSTVMVLIFRKSSPIKTIVILTIALFVLVFYKEIIEVGIKFVSVIIGDNPVYNTKLDGFLKLYQAGELGDSAWGERFSNYAASCSNVVKYPFVGSYFWGDSGGGGHSTVLDTVGKYGWISAILYFTIVWKYPRLVYVRQNKKHILYTTMLVVSLIFGLLDPYTQEMAVSWFLMTPFIVYMDDMQSIKMEKESGGKMYG